MIIGKHKIQGLADSERGRQFQAERRTPFHSASQGKAQLGETTSDSPIRSYTTSREVTGADVYRIADLCQEEPFWDALRLPASLRSFESLGNTVAVGRFPAPVPFIVRMIICGYGMVSTQVEIREVSRTDALQDISALTGPVLSTPPKSMELRPFKKLSSSQLGAATVDEHLTPVFNDEGIYIIEVKLNGNAAGKLPLFVRLEQ
jgi:hypothetical protein